MPEDNSLLVHALVCRSFIEHTNGLRRKLFLKKEEYHKAAMDPGSTPSSIRRLATAISRLEERLKRRWPR